MAAKPEAVDLKKPWSSTAWRSRATSALAWCAWATSAGTSAATSIRDRRTPSTPRPTTRWRSVGCSSPALFAVLRSSVVAAAAGGSANLATALDTPEDCCLAPFAVPRLLAVSASLGGSANLATTLDTPERCCPILFAVLRSSVVAAAAEDWPHLHLLTTQVRSAPSGSGTGATKVPTASAAEQAAPATAMVDKAQPPQARTVPSGMAAAIQGHSRHRGWCLTLLAA